LLLDLASVASTRKRSIEAVVEPPVPTTSQPLVQAQASAAAATALALTSAAHGAPVVQVALPSSAHALVNAVAAIPSGVDPSALPDWLRNAGFPAEPQIMERAKKKAAKEAAEVAAREHWQDEQRRRNAVTALALAEHAMARAARGLQ